MFWAYELRRSITTLVFTCLFQYKKIFFFLFTIFCVVFSYASIPTLNMFLSSISCRVWHNVTYVGYVTLNVIEYRVQCHVHGTVKPMLEKR